jgi:hypothetical protein
MSEILNKIKLRIKRCEAHEQATTVVFISDLKEIVMRLDELEDLQDAIADKFLHDPVDPDKFKILINAVKQSMERAKQ